MSSGPSLKDVHFVTLFDQIQIYTVYEVKNPIYFSTVWVCSFGVKVSQLGYLTKKIGEQKME